MTNSQGPNPGFNTHHEILVIDAATMQSRYKTAYPVQSLGGFFFKSGIDDILNQANCIGIRYYYVLDGGTLKIILLGVEKQTYIDMTHKIMGMAQTDPPYTDGNSITTLDQEISLAEAIALTSAYQTANPGLPEGGFFFRSIFDVFIDADDVIGIRYKFGIDSGNKLKVIINPVNTNFLDMDMFNFDGLKIKAEMSGDYQDPASPL